MNLERNIIVDEKSQVKAQVKAVSVSCRNIVKYFGKKTEDRVYALRGVNLDVQEGELFMLVGPSGCGKTTLISVIAGILTQDEGDCVVLNKSYSKMKGRETLDFRAKNIGFIFQNFNLLPSLNIAENVAIPLIINGEAKDIAVKKATNILADVGLKGREKSFPNQLSGGQQQRVAIARALVHEPKIVVCDEPTSALDHETGEKIMQLMKDLNARKKTTFIVVTHDNRIFNYATRIAHMDDGVISKIE
jgi:putative ABC transport system ATP-binding protein